MSLRVRSWLIALLVLGLAGAVFAQKRETLRTVRGTVIGPDGKPLPEAVVHLKNRKTGSVLTVLTDAEGAYDFSGLPMKVDYELYVEYKDLKSVVKKFSGLDRRTRITLNFDLQPREKETEKPAEKPVPPPPASPPRFARPGFSDSWPMLTLTCDGDTAKGMLSNS